MPEKNTPFENDEKKHILENQSVCKWINVFIDDANVYVKVRKRSWEISIIPIQFLKNHLRLHLQKIQIMKEKLGFLVFLLYYPPLLEDLLYTVLWILGNFLTFFLSQK